MWYLSEKQSCDLQKLSDNLFKKNGWMDQFVITNKVLAQLHAEINNILVGKLNKQNILKEIVDTLIVLQHPINHLNISNQEIYDIAFKKHTIDGKEKDPKINRTYRRILNIQDYKPTDDLQFELKKMAKRIIKSQENFYDNSDKPNTNFIEKTGIKCQISIAASEPLELATELSNFIRFHFISGTNDAKEKGIKNNRKQIVDEIYDVLYCLRYIMIVTDINENNLQEFADKRIKDIYNKEIGEKK